MQRILVVDDEEHILELVKFNLEREGYEVLTATNGDEALNIIKMEKLDLIVLDIMLPGIDGLSICKMINNKDETRNIPIIMLSARGEELDKVLGLEMGADDYVTKPFSPRELVARVKARLRRKEKSAKAKLNTAPKKLFIGDLIIDEGRFAVIMNGHQQSFTPKEFELLSFLARNPGRVFSRDFLLEKIWGYDYTGDSRTIDVHIRHIRKKLEQIPGASDLIETVRGIGYKFKEV